MNREGRIFILADGAENGWLQPNLAYSFVSLNDMFNSHIVCGG